MRFIWTPAKHNKASEFIIRVASLPALVMKRGEVLEMSQEQFQPYKIRLDALVASGELKREAEMISVPVPKVEVKAESPAPAPSEFPSALVSKTLAQLRELAAEKMGKPASKSLKKAELVALLSEKSE